MCFVWYGLTVYALVVHVNRVSSSFALANAESTTVDHQVSYQHRVRANSTSQCYRPRRRPENSHGSLVSIVPLDP